MVYQFLFIFRLAASCVQNTVGCHVINVPKSGPWPFSREIRTRCNKVWPDIRKEFIGECVAVPGKAPTNTFKLNTTITDYKRPVELSFSLPGDFDFICPTYFVEF